MLKISLALILIVVSAPCIWSANYFQPTSLGSSADSISVSVDGFGRGAHSLWENPASLTNSKSFSIAGFSTTILEDYRYSNLALSKQFGDHRFAVGIYELRVVGVPSTDDQINSIYGENQIIQIGSETYRNIVAKLAYQTDISDQISIGIASSYFETSLFDTKGVGFNADIGVFLTFNTIDFSFVGKNVIPFLKVNYNDSISSSEDLPIASVISARKRFSRLHIMAQMKSPSVSGDTQNKQLFSAGLKLFPIKDRFYFSGSGKQYYVLNTIHRSWATGVGITLPFANISYGFEKSDYTPRDNHHYISLAILI